MLKSNYIIYRETRVSPNRNAKERGVRPIWHELVGIGSILA